MNEPTPASSVNGDGHIPSWMKTVDEDTLYNAEPTEAAEEETTSSAPPPSSPPNDQSSEAPSPDESALRKDLALSMAAPSDIPAPDPDLQPTPVGRVRADLDKQLEKAVSVLSTRYAADLSRTLILEFALRQTLFNLREHGEKSVVVQWLDSILPRV